MNLALQRKDFTPAHANEKPYSKFNDADYLAFMCHEIGTPLTAIVGLSYVLANVQCNPEKKQECALMLHENANMLMGLMKSMLEVSKLEAGMLEVEKIEFNMATIVREVTHIILPRAQTKGIGLIVNLGQMPECMIGDPIRIQQIIFNLISNAVKFTSAGYVRLDVQALPDVGGNMQITINVTDTGIGMSPQQISCVFDKYKQAESSTSRKYGGMGLGLTICQELARLMQGDVRVKSTLGMGSCFTALLSLPQASATPLSIVA